MNLRALLPLVLLVPSCALADPVLSKAEEQARVLLAQAAERRLPAALTPPPGHARWCVLEGQSAMSESQCCGGLVGVRVSEDIFECRAPQEQCGGYGQGERYPLKCCPGLEQERESVDYWRCVDPLERPLPPAAVRCEGAGASVRSPDACCAGLDPERESEEFWTCVDPTGKRCSRQGEYEDHKFGCCPGTTPTRVSNDAYRCY